MFGSSRLMARTIRRRSVTALLFVAVAAGSGTAGVGAIAAVQAPGAPLPFRPPEALVTACEMERWPLTVEVVATSTAHYPRHAERVPGGWLVYERYDQQVVELDDDLREVARWGRKGPGPLEYRGNVPGFGRTESGGTFVVDDSPPSVMTFGATGTEYRLDVPRPHHAVAVGDRLMLASSAGIHEATISGDETDATTWSHEDLGIDISEDGKPSRYLLRSGDGSVYAAATSQSAIWALSGKDAPRKVVQRCVPKAWQEMHRKAPVFERGRFKGQRYSLRTLGDYAVLDEGRLLALGTLHTNADLHSSLELYNADGEMVWAWEIPMPSSSRKVFDPYNPRRLLVWGPWKGEEHVRLIEVDGENYPSS